MKNVIADIFAVLWFFGVLVGTLLLTFFFLFFMVLGNIIKMLQSGFSAPTIGFFICFMAMPVWAVTGWVPVFRRCYYKFPWLYPLSMISLMHLFILSIAEAILARGFDVMSAQRHVVTIVVMIIQLIICRIVMCVYLKKHPMILHKYDLIDKERI